MDRNFLQGLPYNKVQEQISAIESFLLFFIRENRLRHYFTFGAAEKKGDTAGNIDFIAKYQNSIAFHSNTPAF